MEHKLQFIDASAKRKNYKATLQSNGKLVFTQDCNSLMNLEKDKAFGVAVDTTNKEKIYLVEQAAGDKTAKVLKSGTSFYLNFINAVEEMKIDLSKGAIQYSIEKSNETYENMPLYILSKSVTRRKQSERKTNQQ